MNEDQAKIVFWHRELPPLEADLVAEHTVEANSSRVPGTLAHHDELWDQCYRELMANAEHRLVQEARAWVGTLRTSTTKRSIQDTTTPPSRRGSMADSATCCTDARRNRD